AVSHSASRPRTRRNATERRFAPTGPSFISGWNDGDASCHARGPYGRGTRSTRLPFSYRVAANLVVRGLLGRQERRVLDYFRREESGPRRTRVRPQEAARAGRFTRGDTLESGALSCQRQQGSPRNQTGVGASPTV